MAENWLQLDRTMFTHSTLMSVALVMYEKTVPLQTAREL